MARFATSVTTAPRSGFVQIDVIPNDTFKVFEDF
jgi:hypothetical protein